MMLRRALHTTLSCQYAESRRGRAHGYSRADSLPEVERASDARRDGGCQLLRSACCTGVTLPFICGAGAHFIDRPAEGTQILPLTDALFGIPPFAVLTQCNVLIGGSMSVLCAAGDSTPALPTSTHAGCRPRSPAARSGCRR